MEQLDGRKIAILVADGFEKSELMEPRKALEEAGAQTVVISPHDGEVKSWDGDNWGESVKVDLKLEDARAGDYDGLLLPGGVMNPDQLRVNRSALDFVKGCFDAGKPVAVICHGPWTLIDAGVIKGQRITSWPSLKSDLVNADAEWVDEEVVVDQGLVSSRKPDDLPAFNKKMIEEFAEGRHDVKRATAG